MLNRSVAAGSGGGGGDGSSSSGSSSGSISLTWLTLKKLVILYAINHWSRRMVRDA